MTDQPEQQPVNPPGVRRPRPLRQRRKRSARSLLRHKLRRIGLGALPFFVFLLGLSMVSIGLARYIEQESVVSLFLTRRDAPASYAFHGDDWSALPETELTEGETRTVQPAEPDRRLTVPFFYIGEQIGILRIPSVDIETAVLQGDREDEFRRGAGHYPGSFLPGQDGNILIGAHRTSFFRNFEFLEMGAMIEIKASYGRFTYEVSEMFLINGDDHSIAGASDEERLTLYTCYPFTYIGNAPQRFVVIGRLVHSEVHADE